MATDLATLAIKVENGDVIKATTSLDGLTVAGGKSEAATSRLTRRMALLELEARQMDASMVKTTTTLGRVASTMGISEAAAGKLTHAFEALSVVAALGFIGHKTIEETELAQAAMAQLEAAVASTGGVAGRTVGQLDALSIALQKTTTFSDEAVKGAEAMLLTFDKIRGENFDRATRAVTDLATRMGGDLQAAAVQVGKALQDPETGLTALRRSGVSFSKDQIEVIRKLYETGQAAEGQRVILKELEHQFGGSAAAARDTLGGALTGLKNAWGDLFEVTRGASQGTVTGINAITAALENSGLSMNKILKDATVDWETMRASIEKVKTIMALPIGPGFLQQARNIIERIDFDLSTKIAALNAPAKVGPAITGPPIRPDVDTKQAAKDLAELQKATDAYYNTLNQHQIDAITAAKTSREQNDQLRALIAAYGDSQDAVERVTIAQAGENAVKDLGVGVSEKVIASVRREAEEHERLAIQLGKVKDAQADAARDAQRAADDAQRQMEQRAKELHRTISNTIEGILTDIDQHRNPFVAIFDNLKRGAIRAISDILATKIEGKVGEWLGIQMPADKITKGGTLINQGADKILRAAELMSGGKSTAGGIVIPDNSARSTSIELFKKAMGIGGAAYGGYQSGYGIGSATQSGTLGAVGGAYTGAKLGFALGGPVGAAVGGIAGFVGGIIGAGDAARAARERILELKAAFQTTFDSLRAELNKDTLGQSVAQVKAQYQSATQQFKEANSIVDTILSGAAGITQYAKTMADLSAMEAQRIAQLEQEAALIKQQAQEDLDVRTLRDQGRQHDADILQKRHEDERELAKATEAHMSDAYIAQLKQNQAMEEAAVAAGTTANAFNALATAVRGGPSGYKINGLIQQYGAGLPHPGGQWSIPTPLMPPMSPLSPPMLSRTGTVGSAASITFAPGSIVVNESKTPQLTAEAIGKLSAKAFLGELDKTVAATGGLNTTRAVALNKMTVS